MPSTREDLWQDLTDGGDAAPGAEPGSRRAVPALVERDADRSAAADASTARAPAASQTEPRQGTDRRRHTGRAISVAIIGATGYAGGELVRLLHRHPHVEIVGLGGRGRDHERIEASHPHLAGTGYTVDADVPEAEAVFIGLPHGASSGLVPMLVDRGASVVDVGPDFRLRDPADYPRWYGFEHPARELLARAVYGLPELHRDELLALRDRAPAIVGSPGCYPTASLLAVAPLARAGLVADLVIDAKSGVSGAGREPKPEYSFSEVNESLRAYGLGGHRHVAEIEQELAGLGGDGRGGAVAGDGRRNAPVDFLPHLVPMTRGILATAYVRPPRTVDQAELDALYREAYAAERFVQVVSTPPATKHVLGSNLCRVYVRADERTGRIVAIGVIDNLVKGAAGQAIQAFNLVHGLPEDAGLEQLPLAP